MKKAPQPAWLRGFPVAAGEGFEPSQTESESGVLPLHKPAVSLRATDIIIPILAELSILFSYRFLYSGLTNRPKAITIPHNKTMTRRKIRFSLSESRRSVQGGMGQRMHTGLRVGAPKLK